MDRKKLLFLITTLGGGGAEKVLIDIVNHLDLNRYEITVCTLENDGIYRDQLRPDIHYRTVTQKPGRIKRALLWRAIKYLPRRWVYHFCVRGDYDVEIAFLEGPPTAVLSGSSGKGRKLAWVHNDMEHLYYVEHYFRSLEDHRACYRAFDSIVCVSQSGREGFESRLGPMDKLCVINNLIDTEQIRTKAALPLPEEAKLETDGEAPVLCTVGRLIPDKGFDRLLACHKRLLDDGLNHRLWIVGEGEQREELERIIRENGLESSVRLWGFWENPYPFVKNADLYVSSSFAEGYPLSVAEALVLERPIMGTHCAGTDEILGRGSYGFLVENSEEGIYQGLRQLLSSREEYDGLCEKARQGAGQFQADAIISRIEDLFIG